jgi:pimeloyl-ACP methyl ester carboxylesterase
LAQLIPGANFEEFNGAAHGVIIDRAEAINRRLREFIGAAEQARCFAEREVTS